MLDRNLMQILSKWDVYGKGISLNNLKVETEVHKPDSVKQAELGDSYYDLKVTK